MSSRSIRFRVFRLHFVSRKGPPQTQTMLRNDCACVCLRAPPLGVAKTRDTSPCVRERVSPRSLARDHAAPAPPHAQSDQQGMHVALLSYDLTSSASLFCFDPTLSDAMLQNSSPVARVAFSLLRREVRRKDAWPSIPLAIATTPPPSVSCGATRLADIDTLPPICEPSSERTANKKSA